jgi:hypothetical protein
MELIEQIVIRECLRQAHGILGLDKLDPDVCEKLNEIDPAIDGANARRYVHNQNVAQSMAERISNAAISVLRPNIGKIEEFYVGQSLPESAAIIKHIINKESRTFESPSKANFAVLARNWTTPVSHGDSVLLSGVYQIFRRYKPMKEQKELIEYYRDDQNHAVICELAYVDSNSMECMLVTAERNLYWGSLYINHQQIMYVLAQRPSEEQENGIHQRIYAVKLEGGPPTIYSGLCMKSGDMTKMPLSAECIFLFVSEARHQGLYAEFSKLRQTEWSKRKIGYESPIADYITENPPTDDETADDFTRSRIRRVSDFPMLSAMVKEEDQGIILLRESLRTLPAAALRGQLLRNRLRVFRQSDGV